MAVGSGNVRVRFTADSSDLQRGAQRAGDSIDRFERRSHRSIDRLKTAAKGAGLAMAAALAVGVKGAADAAIESEKSQARLKTQLDALGISFDKHAKKIDEVIQKHSQLSGLDDEDLQDAFTNIVRITGDVDKGLRLTGLAADFARAKHMDVAKAGDIVAKVAGGNTGVLSRYGIVLKDNATASDALAALQKKFAGQAEAYGKTTAGSLDRAQVASENLGEVVGAKLTPLLAKGAEALVDLIDKSGGLAGPIRTATGAVRNAYNAVRDAISRFVASNREDINAVIEAAKRLGKFFKNVFEDVIVPVVRRTIPIIKGYLEGVITAIRGLVRIVSGIINGDWRRVWDGVKDIVRGALKAVVSVIGGLAGLLKDAMVGLAKKLIKALVDGLKALPGAIKNAIISGVKAGVNAAKGVVGDIISAINPFGDGIGRLAHSIGDGVGASVPRGVNLAGADPDLYPFAAMASSMGLRTSSGIRPGAVTSSGNQSYHATGDAIDELGSMSAMRRYAVRLFKNFGGRLRELISPWPELGIKDGRPYRYSSQIQAEHSGSKAHVHVAYTGPFGDGEGQPGVVSAFRKAIRTKHANRMEQLALWEAGIVESGLRNLHYGDADSLGALQERTSIYGREHALNPFKSAIRFLSDAQRLRPWKRSAGMLAAAVQRPAPQYRGRYDAVKGRAIRFLEAGGKGKGKGKSNGKPGLGLRLGDEPLPDPPPAGELVGGDTSGSGASDGGNAAALAALTAELRKTREFNQYLISTQGPQIVGAVIAAVNGGIGGKVGLGFSGIRSPAGDTAGL